MEKVSNRWLRANKTITKERITESTIRTKYNNHYKRVCCRCFDRHQCAVLCQTKHESLERTLFVHRMSKMQSCVVYDSIENQAVKMTKVRTIWTRDLSSSNFFANYFRHHKTKTIASPPSSITIKTTRCNHSSMSIMVGLTGSFGPTAIPVKWCQLADRRTRDWVIV